MGKETTKLIQNITSDLTSLNSARDDLLSASGEVYRIWLETFGILNGSTKPDPGYDTPLIDAINQCNKQYETVHNATKKLKEALQSFEGFLNEKEKKVLVKRLQAKSLPKARLFITNARSCIADIEKSMKSSQGIVDSVCELLTMLKKHI